MTELEGEIIQSQTPAGAVAVVKIKYGQKVDHDGIYDIPMGWYHDDCCVGPSISSTGLRTIWNKSPLHYWDKSPLNKERDEDDENEEETAALRIGRAAHTLVLEPELFTRQFTTRPSMFTSWQTNAAKKWRAEHQAEGYTVLDPPEMQRVVSVARALRKHPLYDRGLLDGEIERALIWRDKKSGIWLKSRPDNIPVGSNIFTDLKVVHDASAKALKRKVFDFGYDMQMALAGVGMWEVLRRSIEEYVLVAVESKRPHGIRIAPISHDEIKRALSLLRASITKFAQCLEANDWPSFEDDDNEYVSRHEAEAKRIDSMIQTGALPKEF